MKIIYNNYIPFKGFLAINICGLLFVRNYANIKEKFLNDKKYQTTVINHESIHTELMKELGYIFFYLIYVFEWLFRVLFTKDRFTHQAYRNISFEQEAFGNENNLDYLTTRKHYAMWR